MRWQECHKADPLPVKRPGQQCPVDRRMSVMKRGMRSVSLAAARWEPGCGIFVLMVYFA